MKDFTKGKELPEILKFAVPMLLGNLFMQLYQFVDTAIVGKFVGKEALAAVGASTPVIFMVIALVMGVGIGASIIISQYFGVKRRDMVQKATDTMMVAMLSGGVLVTVFGFLGSEWILRVMQLPEELIPMAADYLKIYFAGSVLFFGFNSVAAVLRGLGDSKNPLYFLIVSALLNVALDLLFILVFGWGVKGAAWATVISQGVAFLLAVWYINRKHEFLKFNILRPNFDRRLFWESLRLGLPSGLQQTFVGIGMVALMGVVNGFGTDVIAAYSAVNRIDTFVSMPVMTFAAALTTFVGQNIGAGKFIRVYRGLRATLLMSTITCLVLNGVLILFGREVLSIFTHDPAVKEVGYRCLVAVNSTYMIFMVMFTVNGLLRGAGATIFPMFTTLLSLWLIRLPAAVFLSKHFGADGIWWSLPIGWAVGMIGSLIYFWTGHWKKMSVVKRASARQAAVAVNDMEP